MQEIKAPLAWSSTTGHRIKVGVIDTGVDFSHPDLKHSLGRGINLLNRGMLPHDDNGHGTHIAGTIAAANQLHGMIGVAPRAMIYPVKAFDHNGSAFVSDIMLGIDWCVRNRMDIINMSFGMKTRSKSLLTAVTERLPRRRHHRRVLRQRRQAQVDRLSRPLSRRRSRSARRTGCGASRRSATAACYIDVYAPGDKIFPPGCAANTTK